MRIDVLIGNPGHHLAMMGPVIRRLAMSPRVAVRVASLCELRGHRTPAEMIERLGASVLRLCPVRLSKTSEQISHVRRHAAGRFRLLLQSVVWRGVIDWKQLGRPSLPDLVVLPNDSAFPYDRVTDVLRAWGVPFILIQEGIRFDLPAAQSGRRYGEGGAQMICAWGPSSVRYFAGLGVPAERLRAVGNPRLDAILAVDWAAPAAAIKAALGLGQGVLVFLSNPIDTQGFCSTEQKYQLFARFVAAAAPWLDQRGIQMVVKIHPSESLSAYRALAAVSPAAHRIVVLRDVELYPLLHLASAAIILATTAGLEALLLGVPLGALEVPGVGFLYDFVQEGAAVPLRVDEAVGPALAALVDRPDAWALKRKAYLADHVSNLGVSAEAIADLLQARLGASLVS